MTVANLVPYSTEVIEIASKGYGFQSRDVLRSIIEGEQARIKQEQMLWRMGGALVGAFLGLGDGFNVGDIFLGMAFSNLAGMSHEVLSHEQRKFLETCKSLWLVDAQSPINLAQRLGQARSRILAYSSGWDEPIIFNHHQGPRGEYLVPLGFAGQLAVGFINPDSKEVLQRNVGDDNINLLQCQLYPNETGAIRVNSLRKIDPSDARRLDPYASAFLHASEPLFVEVEGVRNVVYRIPIPVYSDF